MCEPDDDISVIRKLVSLHEYTIKFLINSSAHTVNIMSRRRYNFLAKSFCRIYKGCILTDGILHGEWMFFIFSGGGGGESAPQKK